jgi:hypothetical protein
VSNASASTDKSCAKGPDDHATALVKLRELSRIQDARTQDEEKRATDDIEMDANFCWHSGVRFGSSADDPSMSAARQLHIT